MKVDVRISWLACSVLLIGCRTQTQQSKQEAPAKEPPKMIQIQNLSVMDKTLTLDYQVSNPFEDDIRVFRDTRLVGFQGPVTRINEETVWIKLRLCIDRDPNVYVDPPGIAKYLRLSPGESCSGRILLDLPIRDDFREWREGRKEHKEIVLRRAVFEIGYFGSRFNKIFEGIPEQLKALGIERGIEVNGDFHYLPLGMAIAEEMQYGQSRQVTFISERVSFLCKEESARVVITDIAIPCSVVDEE